MKACDEEGRKERSNALVRSRDTGQSDPECLTVSEGQ